MEFFAKTFDQLTTRELYEIVRARTQIFLLEQGIICQDFDGVDYDSLHCFLQSDGKLLAYLRAYRTESGEVKIGRVLSLTHKMGHGKELMRHALPKIASVFECDTIHVGAQTQALGFYESVGFVKTSDEFLDEGIPHVHMELKLS